MWRVLGRRPRYRYWVLCCKLVDTRSQVLGRAGTRGHATPESDCSQRWRVNGDSVITDSWFAKTPGFYGAREWRTGQGTVAYPPSGLGGTWYMTDAELDTLVDAVMKEWYTHYSDLFDEG